MGSRTVFTALIAGAILVVSAPSIAAAPVLETHRRPPLAFEPSRGPQGPFDFVARGNGYDLFLTGSGPMLTLRGHRGTADAMRSVLRLKLEGANPRPTATGLDELPGKSHYLLGDDPAKWRIGVPTYARVHYRDVYPGIDVVFYGAGSELEYDFVVAPGADPGAIRIAPEGAHACDLDDAGNLILRTPAGTVVQRIPHIYQNVDGKKRRVAGRFVLARDRSVGFEIATYDTDSALVIDPVLEYSTYLGRGQAEFAGGIDVDDEGNVYLAGRTGSMDFPTTPGAADATLAGSGEAFVTKLSADGGTILYSTFLGGDGDERGVGVRVRGASVYVAGETSSSNFPTVDPLQPDLGGGRDGFVAKLSEDGSTLLYSTYLGGNGFDDLTGMEVDASGSVYVAGTTPSSDFPTAHAIQADLRGDEDAFVARLHADGSSLVFSTYHGGSGDEFGNGIDVDAAGNAYLTGFTDSSDLPTANALDGTLTGFSDAFAAKLTATGSSLVYSTYLGGAGEESGFGVAADDAGNAYITGDTDSTDFPVLDPFQGSYGGGSGFFGDAFVTKLDAAGSAMVYSTYLGGSTADAGVDIEVDSSGEAHVTGFTRSVNFPTTDAFQGTFGGTSHFFYGDAFVARFGPDGDEVVYSSYLGGAGEDVGLDLALDGDGTIWVAGSTSSDDFPTADPLQDDYRGSPNPVGEGGDAFVARISAGPREDTTPPTLVELSIEPTMVDVSTADAEVTLTLRVSDDLSGVSTVHRPHAALKSPSSRQLISYPFGPPTSGDLLDGTYELTRTIPAHSEPGTWSLSFVDLFDAAENRITMLTEAVRDAGFPTDVTVVSATPDETAPVLVEFSIDPPVVDVNEGPAMVTLTYRVTDDLTGVDQNDAGLRSPSGQTSLNFPSFPPPLTGDTLDGTYSVQRQIPAGAEPGTWEIQFFDTFDVVRNRSTLSTEELEAAGFPTTLTVLHCIDEDEDGYGDPGDASCPGGDAADCEGTDPDIHPGAEEICGNGVDEDCDGADEPCPGQDDLFADFGPGVGSYVFENDATWGFLTGLDPVTVATGDLNGNGQDDLVAYFGPAIGTYAYLDDSTWSFLTGLEVETMLTADLDASGSDDLVVEFPGVGIYVLHDATTWSFLTGLEVESMVAGRIDDTDGEDLVLRFVDSGTYLYLNDDEWRFLTGSGPVETMATGDLNGSGRDDVIVVFGGGIGTYVYYDDSTWQFLTGLAPVGPLAVGDLDGSGQDDLVIPFDSGLGSMWVYRNDAEWGFLGDGAPLSLAVGDLDGSGEDDLVVQLGPGDGIDVYYNDSQWSRLTSLPPELLVTGDLDGP